MPKRPPTNPHPRPMAPGMLCSRNQPHAAPMAPHRAAPKISFFNIMVSLFAARASGARGGVRRAMRPPQGHVRRGAGRPIAVSLRRAGPTSCPKQWWPAPDFRQRRAVGPQHRHLDFRPGTPHPIARVRQFRRATRRHSAQGWPEADIVSFQCLSQCFHIPPPLRPLCDMAQSGPTSDGIAFGFQS